MVGENHLVHMGKMVWSVAVEEYLPSWKSVSWLGLSKERKNESKVEYQNRDLFRDTLDEHLDEPITRQALWVKLFRQIILDSKNRLVLTTKEDIRSYFAPWDYFGDYPNNWCLGFPLSGFSPRSNRLTANLVCCWGCQSIAGVCTLFLQKRLRHKSRTNNIDFQFFY